MRIIYDFVGFMSPAPIFSIHLRGWESGWGGRGVPDLLQYYIGGDLPNLSQYYIGVGLESLLQYYSFERKMEGYNPFSALNKLKGFHFILFNVDLCLRILSQIRKNVANTRF